MHNRMSVLEAIQTLGSIAVGMHRSESFRNSCQWNFEARGLVSRNTALDGVLFSRRRRRIHKLQQQRHGNIRVRPDSAKIVHDRIKLAGIHRAQPMSYLYEHDMLHDCTLADWADLIYDEQLTAYTQLREFRSENEHEVIKEARREWESTTSRAGDQMRAPITSNVPTAGWRDGDWIPEELVPEGCDGLGAVMEFDSGRTCNCDYD
ncbi:hypothetical protein CSAL01_13670 [Colletotrichum salicis]|uniref:Uncharacterized protein n=1 Tax=Colletotrichum salicis TaxID=1209931 RepID=A0A135UIQ3_9PEZI|nr:hypothetical protein CSAL01_13670 [Colletotrichum salicis]